MLDIQRFCVSVALFCSITWPIFFALCFIFVRNIVEVMFIQCANESYTLFSIHFLYYFKVLYLQTLYGLNVFYLYLKLFFKVQHSINIFYFFWIVYVYLYKVSKIYCNVFVCFVTKQTICTEFALSMHVICTVAILSLRAICTQQSCQCMWYAQ